MQAVKTRLLRPRCIVDLQAVAELRGVSVDGAGVRIGAMGSTQLRACTHLDVNREQVEEAAEAVRVVVDG